MEPDDDKLLEAVGAAIDTATPPDVRQTTTVTDGDDATPQDSDDGKDAPGDAAGGDEEADKGAGADKNAEDTAAANQADRGDGRNAKGEFVKKKNETDEQFAARKAAPDQKGTKGADVDPKTGKPQAPVKADHINDPIPAELNAKTKERMTGLVTIAKTLTTERDGARRAVKEFDDAIKATGADPETFGRHMEVLGAMLSSDPRQQREAVKLLRAVADGIATKLGDTAPGKDPLDGHQDLIDAVEDGDMRKEHAVELAEARNRKKASETHDARRGEQDEATRVHNEVVETARADLNAYGAQLSKDDPAFAAKAKILLPAVQAMAASTHPSRWLGAYKKMYAGLVIAPSAAASVGDQGRQRVAAGTGERQPQRGGKQGAGSGAKVAPTSVEQAIDFGLDAERATRGR